jgi:hypothetical protein
MNDGMAGKACVALLISLSFVACTPDLRGGATRMTPDNSALAALSAVPLDLPRLQPGQPCPLSKLSQIDPQFGMGLGSGPVYVKNLEFVQSDPEHPWKVSWFADPSYSGPIRIRGGRIDGSGRLLLGGGHHGGAPVKTVEGTDLYAELILETDVTSTTRSPWRVWPSFTYIATPGCYAWQVDGLGFTEFITIPTLQLPTLLQDAACPVSPQQVAHGLSAEFGYGPAVGVGPIYALMGEMQAGILNYSQSQTNGWAISKVLWMAKPVVRGRVLIRGHQIDGPIDGPNWIGFGTGKQPEFVLQWEIASQSGWASLPSEIRFRAPGCYAYQIDSQQGSEVITFKVVGIP